jgi:glycine betaine/proline transport system substrate-binding protein
MSRPALAQLLALCLLALGTLSALAQETPAPEALEPPAALCGVQPLSIARMQWPSAQLLAEIHARILSKEFGCEVRIAPGDLAATASSMGATGQPAIAPEMWIARITEIWNPAIKAQKVRQAGVSYAEPTFETWFIPDYVAAAFPDLATATQLKEVAAAFSTDGKKPRFFSCPPDWGCSIINRNMLRAQGLTGLFEVIEPANRFELDTLLAEAVGRKENFVFYYWRPNAVLSQFSFKALDLGPYDKDAFACLGRTACATPAPSAFAPDPVVIALAEWVFTDIPAIASYFQRAAMPVAEMNALLAGLNEPGNTVEGVADAFVANRESIWRPWVGNTP